MTQLCIIRHGSYTRSNEPPYDLGLSPEGILQSEKLKERLLKENLSFDALLSSALPRAKQTAEVLSSALNLEVEIESDLEEWRNQGKNALTQDEIITQYLSLPADQRAFIAPGTGLENWAEFAFRVCNTLQKITTRYSKKNIALVAHGGTIEASFVYCYGASPFAAAPFMMMLDPANTSITQWRYIHQVNLWRLEKYNDASHLESG